MSTLEHLQHLLNTRFDGRLEAGTHAADSGACCALELQSVALGRPWTDDPETLHIWDLRALNDISVPEAVRTACVLPVLAAYTGSRDWPEARQRAVVERLAILTVQRLIAELPGLPDAVRAQCRAADTLEAAAEAAWAARATRAATRAATEAAWAARATRAATRAATEAARAAIAAAEAVARAAAGAAAWGADAAAYAATVSSAEGVFRVACDLWLEAAASAEDATPAATGPDKGELLSGDRGGERGQIPTQ